MDRALLRGPVPFAKIVLEPLEAFYPAEEHHQNFAARNPWQPYIMAVAAPKMEKLVNTWPEQLKPEFSKDDPDQA